MLYRNTTGMSHLKATTKIFMPRNNEVTDSASFRPVMGKLFWEGAKEKRKKL
jgi:hypothetical protein